MTRTQAIHHIRIAGYHNDTTAIAIIHNATGIPKRIAIAAYRDGRKLRANGVRCGCNECAPKSSRNSPEAQAN